MTRSARLQSAKHWLPTYRGKRIVLGYQRWYAVDRMCAIIELRMLGVTVPETEVAAARDAQEAARLQRSKRKEKRAQESAREEAVSVAWLNDWPSETWNWDEHEDPTANGE